MRKLAALLTFLFFAAAAQAQIITTLPFQLQNGTTADATQVMADFNQIVNNVNANAAKSGANSDITSLTGLTTPLAPASGGSSVYTAGASAGTANAQTVASPTPTGFTLSQGKRVVFLAGATNTGAMTLNVASTGALNVYYPTPSGPLALTGGEVRSGNLVEVVYDGTQYQLITNNLAVVGPLTNATAAATVDLGAVATHNVNITGAATISAFGSSASTAYPIYYLTFVGVNTLTYNATSMILPGAADIATAAGDTAVAQYLGSGNWKVWSYQRASGTAVVAVTPMCGATNLLIKNNAGTPNTLIDYSADTAVMVNSSGGSKTVSSLSGTINTTNVGVIDGIQAARVLSTWYNIYFLSNGTTNGAFTVAQGTALSAPAGYTYSCFMGVMRTDAATNLYTTTQKGIRSQWVLAGGASNVPTMPSITSGSSGAVWFGASVSSVAPPSARSIIITLAGGNSTTVAGAAPNASYPAPGVAIGVPLQCGNSGGTNMVCSSTGELVLESTTVYYWSNAATYGLFALGWTNPVNAN
jgi:hypothetical protein